MKLVITACAIALLATSIMSCGAERGVTNQVAPNSNGSYSGVTGSAKLIVSNSQSIDQTNTYGSIKIYRATVSAPDIDPPIVAEFDGSSGGGDMTGIPAGSGRKVIVEAVNQNETLIREGIVEDVSVPGGAVTEIRVGMDAIPIFTNIKDGNVVPSTRLILKVFADPEDPIAIMDNVDENEGMLTDLSTGMDEVYPDVTSGIAVLQPASIVSGEHIFTARSLRTGKASSIKIKLIDGRKLKPAPLFSAGAVYIVGKYVSVSRAGAPFSSTTKSGYMWPNVLEATLGVSTDN